MNPIYFLIAIPVFLLLIGVELLIGHLKRKKLYRFNDTITNLNIGIGNQAFNLFFKAFLFGIYVYVFENLSFFQIQHSLWAFLLCLVVYDFLFYWAHRWGHEINFFWGAHIVHHQSEEFNLSVALRQSWFHNLLAFVIFLPMPLFGFDPLTFFIAAAVNTLYQFWIHTKTIKKMYKWFEAVFNTPSHHRVHHGINPKYIDKNHAGMFIVWDKMFGTFQAEEEEPVYGITTQLKSWNPTWANIHYYIDIISKSTGFSKLKDKIKMLFARPGWLPEEAGGFQAPPEVPANHFAYDVKSSKLFNTYILAQFILIVSGLCLLMYHFNEISTFYKFVFLGVIILSTMICGAIMENKKWVIAAEYIRLILVLSSLNTFYYYWYIDWFYVMLIASGIFFLLFNIWFTFSWIFTFRKAQLSY
jgi:alkylglycerol monooxygenase